MIITAIRKQPVVRPELGMKVFHEEIYKGKELMEIVGIRKTEVELRGDYSGMHNIMQTGWMPLEGTFRIEKVCAEKLKPNGCQLHNIHCGFPDCEPFINTYPKEYTIVK